MNGAVELINGQASQNWRQWAPNRQPLLAAHAGRWLGTSLLWLAGLTTSLAAQGPSATADVLVYGGTPSGVAAGLAAAASGCRVLLIEPTPQLGGLLTSGLSHSDFHSRESLSGAFADFAQRVEQYYIDRYGADSPQVRDSFGGTFGEPKVNLLVLESMLGEYPNLQIRRGERLVATHVVDAAPVSPAPGRPNKLLQSLQCVDASGEVSTYTCQVAIDATYEGDLLAQAGVAWTSGREARQEFNESLAPETADQQLQAYNFRFIMTRDPGLRVTPQSPPGYRREDFVGVLEVLASGGIDKIFGYPSRCIFKAQTPPLPNGKYDINDVSRGMVRLSLPGANLDWPDGSYERRAEIFAEHLRDQVGLLYFLQNDPAVPPQFQQEARQWGWCRDEFTQTAHLPPQLYVREARRMRGAHVFIQQDSEAAPGDARAVLHRDAIAMADYGNNCHGTFHEGPRFGGRHTGEFYHPVPPYQIPYGVLVPTSHCNLLVCCAVSASHVGFCGLRLEPVWMSLGQAAGHAAALAIAEAETETGPLCVQDVAVGRLQARLHAAGSATIYLSDVPRQSPDFAAVQWWGNLGGWHGIHPAPPQPGQRGANLHGQYYAAFPYHTADLEQPLTTELAERWQALAGLCGIPSDAWPPHRATTTRGDLVRSIYDTASQRGLVNRAGLVPRLNPRAIPNQHPPGEVDRIELVSQVVWDSSQLPGIVVDDDQATLQGDWQYSTHTPPYVGGGYLHDLKSGKGDKTVTYTPQLPQAGRYEVRLSHCYNVRRSTNTLVVIHHADGETQLRIDQQQIPEHDGLFRSLGVFRFAAGNTGWVRIANDDTDGKYVIADAVQFLPQ